MALEKFVPTVLKVFGGLCTFIDRIALPLGLSPNCKNVRFAPGMVSTRDGYGAVLTDTAQPFHGVSQLIRANGDRHLLVLTDNGRLEVEFPAGTLTRLDQYIAMYSSMKSAAVYSTQYMAFNDGMRGTMPLYRYNGVAASLVGAGAPGLPATAKESASASAGTGLLAGIHSAVCVFVNSAGDYSGWSPVANWTVTNPNKQTDFMTIPVGPPDTVQRILAVTPKNDANAFVYLPKLILNDNTTTTKTIDIIESDLTSGTETSIRRWISSFIPWLPAGCASYKERLMVWGARATLQPVYTFDAATAPYVLGNVGFRNLAFDGGFTSTLPDGWTAGALGSAGGAVGGSGTPFDGKCYRITGDAASTQRGHIYQTVVNNGEYLKPQHRYGIALLLRPSSGALGGNIQVALEGSLGGTLLTVNFPLTDVYSEVRWRELTGEMATPIANDETAITIRASWVGTSGMGVGAWVDIRIALYDVDDTQYLHSMYVSDTGKPGTFVGQTCVLSIAPDDGEGIRNVFSIRDAPFVAKERSLHAITSATAGEPNTWGADRVDPFAGTPSMHGAADGNGFELLAGRDGLYLFDGASARLVSGDIESVWRGANWALGHRVVMVLDPAKRLVRIALPTVEDANYRGASLFLVLDYTGGWTPASEGGGMKWSVDEFSVTGPPKEQITGGALAVNGLGIHVPVFSVYGGLVNNVLTNSRTFSAPTWTFSVAPTTSTTGQADGRSGNYATRLQWATAPNPTMTIASPGPPGPGYGSVIVFSFRIKCAYGGSVLVSSNAFGDTTTVTLVAGLWTRVVAFFYTRSSTPPADTFTIQLPSTPAPPATDATDVVMADVQIDYQTERADHGFVDTGAGASGTNWCGLLVAPTASLRRDFAGKIPFTYETAPFGAEVGRSTFDRVAIRAEGSGLLALTYYGLGSRTWVATSQPAAILPDEDIEYGADAKGPAVTLVLTNTSEDGWITIRNIGVAAEQAGVGYLRGRNN